MENIVTILGTMELELQRIRLLYLEWALERFKPPAQGFAGMEADDDFRLIASPDGRSFQISPCGRGFCYLGRPRGNCRPPEGTWQEDRNLARDTCTTKNSLTGMLQNLRCALRELVKAESYGEVWGTLQDYWWMKLGMHELAYDGDLGKDPKEKNPVRRQLIRSSHYGEDLRTHVPGDIQASDISHFLSYNLLWNRYGICSFDCGPIALSKGGFVKFSDIAQEVADLCKQWSSVPEDRREDVTKAPVKQMLRKHYDLLLCYDDEIPAKTHREFQDHKDSIRQAIKRVKERIEGREAQPKPAQTK